MIGQGQRRLDEGGRGPDRHNPGGGETGPGTTPNQPRSTRMTPLLAPARYLVDRGRIA